MRKFFQKIKKWFSLLHLPPKFLGLRTSAYFEIFAFFVAMTMVAKATHQPSNFYSLTPNPFWIIVVIIAIQYGTYEALLAAAASSVVFLLGPLPVQTVVQSRFEHYALMLKSPLLWLVAAIYLGESRNNQFKSALNYKKKADEAERKTEEMAEAYTALKNIKEHLEKRIALEMSTSLMAISAFRELEKQTEEAVVKGAMDLVRILIAPEKFSIFLLEKNKLKKTVAEGWEENDQYQEALNSSSPLYQTVIEEKKVVSITTDPEICEEEGVLAAPLIHHGELLGMIKIEQMPFSRIRVTMIECLQTIGEWVGSALARVEKKQKRNEKEK